MLRNVTYIGESTVSDNLETNIMYWLNYNLLNTCAFFNIQLSSSGSYGGEASRLRLSRDSSYTVGRVWEGFRKQWVWQSGIEASAQPINISGVYVNNVFRPASGVGPYAFQVDYPNGRIIFDSAISTSAVVKVEHSINYYQIYNTDSPWWQDVHRNSFRLDDSAFLVSSSGFWAKPPEKRVQLPAIVVQTTPVMNKTPYQIGNLSHIHQQDFRFYILAESNRDLKWIVDTITGQNEEQHACFDTNKLWQSGVYPLNINGSLNNATMNYPDLVRNYPWNRNWHFVKFKGWLPEGLTGQNANLPIFSAVIQATVETFLS